MRANDVNAQDAVCYCVCEDFNEAVSGLVDLGAAVGSEGELAAPVSNAIGLQLFFCFANTRDFRRGVNHVGNDIVIHVPSLTAKNFSERDAFVLGFVSKHWTGDDVADGENTGDVGLVAAVDDDALFCIERDSGFRQAKAVRKGRTADGDENDVGGNTLNRPTSRRFNGGNNALAISLDAGNLARKTEDNALFFENALERFGDVAIHARQNAIEIFDDCHL